MTSHKSRYKNALEIVVVAILLLAGYAIFQRLTGTSAVLLESNLQSNLARASRYLNASKVDTVLVGSSMTGRLLPSYFKGEGMNISNLGLDGCHAPFGLEIILMRKDLPQRVLIETASLDHDPNANEKTVREAIQTPTFKIGRVVEAFRPENRPLSLLYWWCKQLSDRKPGGSSHPAFINDQQNADPTSESSKSELIGNDQAIEEILITLKKRGVDVRLFSIPHADGWGMPQSGRIAKISKDVGIPILEPGVEIAKRTDTLRFTDGAHLDVASATLISQEIARMLRSQPKNP
jgi:hypothetical protein